MCRRSIPAAHLFRALSINKAELINERQPRFICISLNLQWDSTNYLILQKFSVFCDQLLIVVEAVFFDPLQILLV